MVENPENSGRIDVTLPRDRLGKAYEILVNDHGPVQTHSFNSDLNAVGQRIEDITVRAYGDPEQVRAKFIEKAGFEPKILQVNDSSSE